MLLMKKQRIEMGISQAELSRRCKMCSSSICAIELGRMHPYPSQVQKIVLALGWQGDPAELFLEADDDEVA